MKILIFGKNGQIGWELQRTLLPLGTVLALDYPDIDFTRPSTIRNTVLEYKPDLIVNAAAYTAVDAAESESALAMVVNAEGPELLADLARKLGSLLVHYSTEYVFDGSQSIPYKEDDPPNPISAYGRSKLGGDLAVQASGAAHMIFRTSWVYGTRGKNFLLTMLRLAAERTELRIVDDQIGAPTWSRTIAEATAQAVAQLKYIDRGTATGVYNLASSGQVSWYGFAQEIFATMEQWGAQIPRLIAISSAEYLCSAKRPTNSTLCMLKVQQTFGLAMPQWNVALRLAMQELQPTIALAGTGATAGRS